MPNPGTFAAACAALLALSAHTPAARASPEVVVITNPANSTVALTASEIRRLYLGLDAFLPDGTPAQPVDQQVENPVHREFYEKIVRMDEGELRRFWAGLIFTGQATPPQTVSGDEEVKRFVANYRGGIGYVGPGAVDKSVKILLRVP